jgi:hypothetical protein
MFQISGVVEGISKYCFGKGPMSRNAPLGCKIILKTGLETSKQEGVTLVLKDPTYTQH